MTSGRRAAAVALLPPKGRCRLARSGSGRVWLIVGAIGCLGALAFAAVLGGAVFFVFASMRKSGAYQDAMRELRKHPAAVQALGQPIEEGWFVTAGRST